MKRKQFYMHTINNQPAYFNGEQIVAAHRTVHLAASVVQIRQERIASAAYRREQGLGDFDKRFPARLGRVRVVV